MKKLIIGITWEQRADLIKLLVGRLAMFSDSVDVGDFGRIEELNFLLNLVINDFVMLDGVEEVREKVVQKCLGMLGCAWVDASETPVVFHGEVGSLG